MIRLNLFSHESLVIFRGRRIKKNTVHILVTKHNNSIYYHTLALSRSHSYLNICFFRIYISITKLRISQKANMYVLTLVLSNKSLVAVQLPLTKHILTKQSILTTKRSVSRAYMIVSAVWSSTNRINGLPMMWQV